MELKAQVLLKGWDSLTEEQQKRMEETYGTGLRDYTGMDTETAEQVKITLEDLAADETMTYKQAVSQLTERLAAMTPFRADLIITTEIPQAVEGTRYKMYTDNKYSYKKWFDVKDSRVRDSHRNNSAQGWISIGEGFASGERSPAEAFRCRCTVNYRKTLPD